LILSSFILSSCGGALRVPKPTNHNMNMTPQKVIPTKSEWKTSGNLNPDEDISITILIKNKSNKPIESFQTVQEKKMHMIVVSKDLSYFSHIHPEYNGDGEFAITTKFPTAGDYKLIADVTPKGGVDSSIETHWLHINGDVSKAKPIVPERNFTKVADGLKVTLSYDKKKMMSGMAINMSFTIRDEKTNKPITNLQPYLGAKGHMVVMSADLEKYLHVHPMTTKDNGPKVTFMTLFPKKGVYKIWSQFQYEDRVIVVPFIVLVT
jgi:hypothetical protein